MIDIFSHPQSFKRSQSPSGMPSCCSTQQNQCKPLTAGLFLLLPRGEASSVPPHAGLLAIKRMSPVLQVGAPPLLISLAGENGKSIREADTPLMRQEESSLSLQKPASGQGLGPFRERPAVPTGPAPAMVPAMSAQGLCSMRSRKQRPLNPPGAPPGDKVAGGETRLLNFSDFVASQSTCLRPLASLKVEHL